MCSLSMAMRSITFDKNGKLEIGLKFLKSGTFDFLGIGEIRASLNRFGKYPVVRHLLTITVRMGRVPSMHSFNKHVGIGSSSQLLVGECMIYLRSSSCDTGDNASKMHLGA